MGRTRGAATAPYRPDPRHCPHRSFRCRTERRLPRHRAAQSHAGKRLISIPPFLIPEVAAHIENYTQHGADDLLFVGPKNGPLRRPNFTRTWRRATEQVGLIGVHFHDLRHTGNHIAAATGASLRELMGRMGHSTTRAALIYQHRTSERDRLIAEAVSKLAEQELSRLIGSSGTPRG